MNVCILGASGGIGSSVAETLSERGHQVVACYRHNSKDREKNCGQKSNHTDEYINTESLDLTNKSLNKILDSHGFDCIVNAMGLGRSTYSPSNNIPIPTLDLSEQEWEEIVYLNLKLPIAITELARIHKIKKVLHIGSALTANGMHGTAMAQAYSASKRGLFDYCKYINEMDVENISIACLAPGLVKTKMTEGKGLKMIFKSELEAKTVALWSTAIIEGDEMPMTILLPLTSGEN
jgi:NAD(P)-dependent dehydrogenase (short-subunit alcohol dehydrogenase family)